MQLKGHLLPLPWIDTLANIMGMSLVSIYLVLSALVLVISLILCGFLYLSFAAISRNIEDEENIVLIDTDDPGVFSIYKHVLHGNSWIQNLATRKMSTSTLETSETHTENTAHEQEEQHLNQPQEHNYLLKKSNSRGKNYATNDTNSLFSNSGDIEQLPHLEEISLDFSALP